MNKNVYAAVFSGCLLFSGMANAYDSKTILDSILDSQSSWTKRDAKPMVEILIKSYSDKSIRETLIELRGLTDDMADKKYGNKNSIPEENEVIKMRKMNIGIDALYDMYKEKEVE